jgi:1L-myo-inositol 1-phosphate cytidylyltransferase
MKCLILAAGHGSRLREVSESKPLTPVGGVPLIEHVIRGAATSGASEFLVVTGHRAERVEAFLADLAPRLGIAIDWVRMADWDRPNGFSVLAGEWRMQEDYLLLMADHLFDPEIVRRLLAAPRQSIGLRLAVDRNVENPFLDLDDATKVELGAHGEIVRIGKTLQRYDAVDTGIFLATRSLADALRADIAAGGGGSLSEGVQRLADRGLAQTMDIGPAHWIDVDDLRGLERAETLVARGEFRDIAA